MSFACPRIHQNYTSFRLEVFQSLFGSTYIPRFHVDLLSSHSRPRNSHVHKRSFRSSTKLTKQGGSWNRVEDEEKRVFMERGLVTEDGQSQSSTSIRSGDTASRALDTSTDAGASPLLPASNELGRKDWTCASCGFSNFRRRSTCAQCSLPASSSSTRPPEPIRVNSRSEQKSADKSQQWSPYSQRGQEDLRALIQDLKHAASEAETFEEEDQATTVGKFKRLSLEPGHLPISHVKGMRRIQLATEDQQKTGVKRISLGLPESPVMRRLRKERPHKRDPTEEELSALSNNPWASILASPVRHCQGTGVRLPRDLLVPWSFVRRGADDATHLVPSGLADMETIQPAGYVEKVYSSSRDEDAPTEGDESKLTKTSSRPRLVASRNFDVHASKLLQDGTALSGKTTILPYQPLMRQLTSRMIRRDNGATVKGAVQRILSHRVKEDIKRAQHYAENSEERALMDLNSLQWQPDIARRMLNIMRERVLTALESLGIQNNIEPTIVPVPLDTLKTGRMVVVLGKDAGADALKYKFKAAELEPEPSPRIPHQKLRQLLFDKFSGSFLLHINAAPATIPDQPGAVLSKQVPNLLPQTISLNNTIRLPVFNLQHLLGIHTGATTRSVSLRCTQVLQGIKVLGQSRPSLRGEVQAPSHDVQQSKKEHASPSPSPSLLFVSCRARTAQTLAKELWQLWRYQGGEGDRDRRHIETKATSSVLRALERSVEEDSSGVAEGAAEANADACV